MVDFTVAIPTYNGEFRLPEVLDRLRSQVNVESLSWEAIVVDNNSRDGTAQVVQAYQKDFPVPLRYCLESRQGAAFARRQAVQEAQSELIGFLDDDNLPAANWVSAANEFAQTHPKAGAYGSQIHGDFEVDLPPGFERLLPFLAITERGSLPLRYERYKKVLPPSAGLVVRKQAWLTAPSKVILGGRVEGSMLTGEDLEVLSHIQQADWEIWYNPAMEVTHKIPRQRLERSYLIPFFQGIGHSRFITRMLSIQPRQRPLMFLAYTANDLRKITLHFLKHYSHLKTDLVAACEMQLMVSSLLSPFYLWKNGYLTRENLALLFSQPEGGIQATPRQANTTNRIEAPR
jgi:glycosyltransferase involved in cell wall biosynthesis